MFEIIKIVNFTNREIVGFILTIDQHNIPLVSSLLSGDLDFRRNREKSNGPSQGQSNKMTLRKRPRSTQDKKAESMGAGLPGQGQGTIVKRSAGRFSGRRWQDNSRSPRFLWTRIPRSGMRASRGSSGRDRPSHPTPRNVSCFSPCSALASTLCLLSPVSHPPSSRILSRFRSKEWSPFVCPVGPTPAHVYRDRESDTFARMLWAREPPERNEDDFGLAEILI